MFIFRFNKSPVDLAIAVYKQSLNSPDDENVIKLVEELNFPHWHTIIEKVMISMSRRIETKKLFS